MAARRDQYPEIMIRKLITALILVPLAIGFAAFAVANRQTIVISFDPFDQAHPAFALILTLVIGGVVIGGVAAWLRQSKWRRAARLADAQARDLRTELDRLKRSMGASEQNVERMAVSYRPQLTIPPPAA
jgi:uncharacterized integral membrane protein